MAVSPSSSRSTPTPAEIVAGLSAFCDHAGPKISTETIVRWIEKRGGYPSQAELAKLAKKMLARRYARMVMYTDPETGLKVKRLWSFRDRLTGERYYQDLLKLPEERRRLFVQRYLRFLDQMKSVRQALADYFAGQEFFEFFVEGDESNGGARLDSASLTVGRLGQAENLALEERFVLTSGSSGS